MQYFNHTGFTLSTSLEEVHDPYNKVSSYYRFLRD
jgi:hypothetical protein